MPNLADAPYRTQAAESIEEFGTYAEHFLADLDKKELSVPIQFSQAGKSNVFVGDVQSVVRPISRSASVDDQFTEKRLLEILRRIRPSYSIERGRPYVQARLIAAVEAFRSNQATHATPVMLEAGELSADEIAAQLLAANSEFDMPHLRDLILLAEKTQFTGRVRYHLAEWLLSFAESRRVSDDPQDTAAVWSAIRRGSTLLEYQRADRLQNLLEPGHEIETSAVTLKMLGRIFEAHPPSDVDCHLELSDQVNEMAKDLLKKSVLVDDKPAARATLAVYALAAMASSHLRERVHNIRELEIGWFQGIVSGDLQTLLQKWSKPKREMTHSVRELVDGAQRMLDSQ